MTLRGRRRKARLLWKWVWGRMRLQDKRFMNRSLRHALMQLIDKCSYYERFPWYKVESEERRERTRLDRYRREDKRLVNLTHHYPPFLATHHSARFGRLMPDVPPMPEDVKQRLGELTK